VKQITIKQSFEDIIINNNLYIDKTNSIYKLINSNDSVFLKKPRRFWKSMLISTLYSLFSWREDLFDWLYIKEQTNYDFAEFPIIYITFANFKASEYNDKLEYYFNENIYISYEWTLYNRHDFNIETNTLGELIKKIYNKFWKQVVLLVDEYDKIATENFNNSKLNDYIDILDWFYSWIKEASLQRYLKFTLISWLTKILSNHLLSTLNHLNDISNDYSFYSICGYTKEEIINNFDQSENDYLPLLALKNNNTIEKELQNIKNFYNGYNFWNENDLIYNPYSINLLFDKQTYDYYWSDTWRSSLIVNYLSNVSKDDYNEIIEKIKRWKLTNIWSHDILELKNSTDSTSIWTLLYITWYLTYKQGKYVLPNKETRISVIQDFINIVYWYNSKKSKILNYDGRNIIEWLLENDKYLLSEWLEWLKYLLVKTVYQWQFWNPEGVLKIRLQDMFELGLNYNFQELRIEESTNDGDADMIIIDKYRNTAVIIEAKWSEKLEKATHQAIEQYMPFYKADGYNVIIFWIRWNKDKQELTYTEPLFY